MFFSKKSTGDSLKGEQGSSQVNCAMFGQEGVRPKGRIVGSMTNKNIHNLKKTFLLLLFKIHALNFEFFFLIHDAKSITYKYH